MDRRDISRFFLGSLAGAAMTGERAEATTCVVPCHSQTEAEAIAGVTPVNTQYPPLDVRRYGTNTKPGITPMHAAVQAACDVAGVRGGTVFIAETCLCTQDIHVPVGKGRTVDMVGTGWATGGIVFQGASVKTGLTYAGSGYGYCGTIRNCSVRGQNGAVRGVTFSDVANPRIERTCISGFAGAGAAFLGTLLGVLDHTLFTGCGSSSEGSVEVDRFGSVDSTTFEWRHSYISGGHTKVGGLIINRTAVATIIGGAIESCGIPLRIAHRPESRVGCVSGIVHAVDFENPGNNNPFIEMGAGLVSAFVTAYDVRGCNGSPSGTSRIDHAVSLSRTNGCTFGPNNWAQLNGTSTYELNGSGNLGLVIEPHRNLYAAGGIPWVRVNGSQVRAAGPTHYWCSDHATPGAVARGSSFAALAVTEGATPSVLVSAQGGYHGAVRCVNRRPTTITALTGGEMGMRITMIASNSNTTLTHSTSAANQFDLVRGSNLAMLPNVPYEFIHNGTLWVELRTSS